ncbi:MAG: hypothetical protein QOG26_603 [Solirubrobacterales bacterium]|nr:hypothetical protein [Solirubrobacterales bacterium]
MRRLAFICLLVLTATGSWIASSASAGDGHTYRVELDNAFGLVTGSDVKVAGVIAGSIKGLDVNSSKRAVVTIGVSGPFGDFRADATCSSEPQSLIAEYFIDCEPGHSATKSSGFIPVKNTTTTVANDLVNNTLREPFKERFQLLLNEFGTALAGNPQNLNDAIRRGAPALRSLRQALEVVGKQNKVIRDLNANSDVILAKLAANRSGVVRFIHNANRAATISAQRRTDLGRNFHLLPSFLAELQPTLQNLGDLATQQTPLLTDLNRAAPQLNRLVALLPPFNDATRPSLVSLGEAAVVGKRAFDKSGPTIAKLRQVGANAPGTFKPLGAFLKSLDDPKYAIEHDARATTDNCRQTPASQLPAGLNLPSTPPQCTTFAAQSETPPNECCGYTGLQGLLNYVYYQTTGINQFDQIGHMLHFILYGVGSSPCFEYNAHSGVPAQDQSAAPPGSTIYTHDPSQINRCVSWLGDNQPDVVSRLGVPPYNGSTCSDGTQAGTDVPGTLDENRPNSEICDPSNPETASRKASTKSHRKIKLPKGNRPGGGAAGGGNALPDLSGVRGLLGLPRDVLKGLNGKIAPGIRSGRGSTANDLLDYLFGQ